MASQVPFQFETDCVGSHVLILPEADGEVFQVLLQLEADIEASLVLLLLRGRVHLHLSALT